MFGQFAFGQSWFADSGQQTTATTSTVVGAGSGPRFISPEYWRQRDEAYRQISQRSGASVIVKPLRCNTSVEKCRVTGDCNITLHPEHVNCSVTKAKVSAGSSVSVLSKTVNTSKMVAKVYAEENFTEDEIAKLVLDLYEH